VEVGQSVVARDDRLAVNQERRCLEPGSALTPRAAFVYRPV
jgi:hypothetical protein